MSTTNLRDILTGIHQEHGTLTPPLLVDLARNPNHPLHNRFEWDDRIAGEKHRLEQARGLLRVTYQVDPEKPTHLRAFVCTRGEDVETSEYVPTEAALEDPFTRALILRQFDRDWKAFRRRYADMKDFADRIVRDLTGGAA